MIIPLKKQAADEQGTGKDTTLRSSVAWAYGAAYAADARRTLRAFLARAPQSGRTSLPTLLAVDAELVVSELVTNAIQHAPGPCGLALHLSPDALTVSVWDTSPDAPEVKHDDHHGVGGRGLRLVHTVSDQVVVEFLAVGKQITAHLPLPARDDTTVISSVTTPLSGAHAERQRWAESAGPRS
ncbi:ATP-binding protein [Streptomyces sp. NRRL B-24085]|uniref:ATP-binding protein n=1 Tax=Streptomyces sp. NRRL B-24085 TaxID=1709476 RepID=UPI0007C68D6D|nr:ATP-binding protein [Streptomyces sp. NRRL B-24085]